MWRRTRPKECIGWREKGRSSREIRKPSAVLVQCNGIRPVDDEACSVFREGLPYARVKREWPVPSPKAIESVYVFRCNRMALVHKI